MFQGQYVPPARCEYAIKEEEELTEEPVTEELVMIEVE